MPVTQLADGGVAALPAGALMLRLDGGEGARLVLATSDNQPITPDGRLSVSEVVLQPRAVDVVVGAQAAAGSQFASESMIGLTVHTPGGETDAVVRLAVECGGRSAVSLARLAFQSSPGRILDAFAASSQHTEGVAQPHAPVIQPWQRSGHMAFHASHASLVETRGRWALVVDGSASMLMPQRRGDISELLEFVYGVGVAGQGAAATASFRCDGASQVDIAPFLSGAQADWDSALGGAPSPWSRVTHTIEVAAREVGDGGTVIVVTDGPPVDSDELVHWSKEAHGVELCVVAIGASRFSPMTGAALPWWGEELSALAPMADVPGHRLVALRLGDHRSVGSDIAAAMFPVKAA